MPARAPGTSIKSPSIDIHPASFDEKSGAVALCSAIAGAFGIAQIRPARMMPARDPCLAVNPDIVSSSGAVCSSRADWPGRM
jgi:hypothetical protein